MQAAAWEEEALGPTVYVKVSMPATMRRALLKQLDVTSEECKLFVFIRNSMLTYSDVC
jgi:hypothetical protein